MFYNNQTYKIGEKLEITKHNEEEIIVGTVIGDTHQSFFIQKEDGEEVNVRVNDIQSINRK